MKTLKLTLLCLLFIICIDSFSQPQWKFHVAYEDATGARDTLWFIWDETATFFGYDISLGEIPLSLNYDVFNVYVFNNGSTTSDTLKTTAYPYSIGFEEQVFAINFVLPITISWDSSLLHAPFLPPEPVGWVNFARLYNNYFHWYGNMLGTSEFDMTITDSVQAPASNNTDPWAWESWYHFPMDISFHQDPSIVIIDRNKGDDGFIITPNPVSDILNFHSKRKFNKIVVYDRYGRQVLKTEIDIEQKSIDISKLKSGIHIINFINHQNHNHYEKFIKSN